MSTIHAIYSNQFNECCLERSGAGNSFGVEEAQATEAILKRSIQEEKTFVFRANGRFFCAGGDVREHSQHSQREPGLKMCREIRRVLDSIHRAPVATLVLVQGDCFGGGIELISAFDKVIASENACFGFWQRKIGLSFGWGGANRLFGRLSAKDVVQMGLEARSFSARQALSIGLVDEVVPRHLLEREAELWISRMSQLPQEPVKVLKGDLLKNEVKEFERIWMNSAHKKFLESLKLKN